LSIANPRDASATRADAVRDAAELQRLKYVYVTLERELIALKSRLAEVSEAKRVLSKGVARKCFRFLGGLLIEVSEEEARKYLEEEEEALKLRIDATEKRRKEVLEKIRELERSLGII